MKIVDFILSALVVLLFIMIVAVVFFQDETMLLVQRATIKMPPGYVLVSNGKYYACKAENDISGELLVLNKSKLKVISFAWYRKDVEDQLKEEAETKKLPFKELDR